MVPTKLPTFAAGTTEGMRRNPEEFSDAENQWFYELVEAQS